MGQELLHHPDRTGEVDVDLARAIIERAILVQRHDAHDAGIVDEHVEFGKARGHRSVQRANAVGIADVALDGVKTRQAAFRTLQRRRVTPGDDDDIVAQEIVAEDRFVDVLAAGCDAGIRYDERPKQDMIAVPIGPRVQRLATAAAPAYLDRHGRPDHPRDLLDHACLLGRFASGALTSPWEFERAGEIVRVEPRGPLIAHVGGATDLVVDTAVAGIGIISLFEDWLRPNLESGSLEPVLEDWWQPFSDPFLHYSDRRLVPPPLRAFIDFIKTVPVSVGCWELR